MDSIPRYMSKIGLTKTSKNKKKFKLSVLFVRTRILIHMYSESVRKMLQNRPKNEHIDVDICCFRGRYPLTMVGVNVYIS